MPPSVDVVAAPTLSITKPPPSGSKQSSEPSPPKPVAIVIPEPIVGMEEAQNQLNKQLQADLEMSDTSDEEGYADAYIINTDAEDEFEEDDPMTDVEPHDTPE